MARLATPAARLLCALIVVAALATVPLHSSATSVAALAVTLLVVALTRPGYRQLWRKLWPGLLVIAALVLPLLLVGRRADAAALGTRAGLALLAAIGFSETLRPDELGVALYSLRVPAVLASVIVTLLRQLEVIRSEARAIGLARRLRGGSGWGLSGEALAVLLIRVSARAERVELAQRLRGFGPHGGLRGAGLAARDSPALAGAVVLATSLHVLGRLA